MTAPPDLRDALIACLAERFNRLPGQCGGHADALIAGPLAGLIAENERLREQNRILDIMGDTGFERIMRAGDERDEVRARLLVAFHDAIRRPLGVTPDSGAEFYEPRMADEAEARRAGRTVLHQLDPEEAAARAGAPVDARRREKRGGGSAA